MLTYRHGSTQFIPGRYRQIDTNRGIGRAGRLSSRRGGLPERSYTIQSAWWAARKLERELTLHRLRDLFRPLHSGPTLLTSAYTTMLTCQELPSSYRPVRSWDDSLISRMRGSDRGRTEIVATSTACRCSATLEDLVRLGHSFAQYGMRFCYISGDPSEVYYLVIIPTFGIEYPSVSCCWRDPRSCVPDGPPCHTTPRLCDASLHRSRVC